VNVNLAAMPVAVPLAMAGLLAAVDVHLPRWLHNLLATLALAAAMAASLRLLEQTLSGPAAYWFGGWTPRQGLAIGISFTVEPVGAGLAALASTIALLALVFSWRWFDTAGARFHTLFLVFTASLNGFGLTGDLFNLFVFFELMSVSAFALTGYKTEDQTALQGAFNFAVTNTLGAVLVLLGLAVVYGRTGALNLAQIGLAMNGADAGLLGGLLLMICGFLVKGAVVPFHFWLSEAHAVAPTPVCMMFSGVMVEAGLFAVARLLHTALANAAWSSRHALSLLLVGVGAITAIVGAIQCFAQRHLKRLLAFSTISHVGIMLMGVALLDAEALAGVVLYALGHGLIKVGLFAVTGILLHLFRKLDESELHGLGRGLPVLGVLTVLGGLALAGLPPFGLFRGQALIDPAERALASWLNTVVLIAGALTGGAVLRAAAHVFAGIGAPEEETAEAPRQPDELPETKANVQRRTPWNMGAVVMLCLLLATASGAWSGLVQGSASAARNFQDFKAYRAAVLGGANAAKESVARPTGALELGVFLRSGIAVALACGVAALALWPPQGRGFTLLRKSLRVLVRPLGRLHSGYVGDYVAWLLLGLAGYTAGLFLLGGLG
jgi:multicomponent Na+:H+ antiporter subunit D